MVWFPASPPEAENGIAVGMEDDRAGGWKTREETGDEKWAGGTGGEKITVNCTEDAVP
jgi:hypothetical protein